MIKMNSLSEADEKEVRRVISIFKTIHEQLDYRQINIHGGDTGDRNIAAAQLTLAVIAGVGAKG